MFNFTKVRNVHCVGTSKSFDSDTLPTIPSPKEVRTRATRTTLVQKRDVHFAECILDRRPGSPLCRHRKNLGPFVQLSDLLI